ncbi:hypothetical protein GGC63_000079 [Paenibacillus sp. OAS669]|nr:hypothetical protein [Paenibacillus sp. OAS669]
MEVNKEFVTREQTGSGLCQLPPAAIENGFLE